MSSVTVYAYSCMMTLQIRSFMYYTISKLLYVGKSPKPTHTDTHRPCVPGFILA